MSRRSRLKEPTVLLRVGSCFLILASILSWIARRNPGLFPEIIDPAMGVFYGLAIGSMLLSLRSGPRGRAPRGD